MELLVEGPLKLKRLKWRLGRGQFQKLPPPTRAENFQQAHFNETLTSKGV
uniref:Uncharacterized protein n=1 Tax=Physcomitrium patens TaxID=3218 RepID=A0A2K1KGS9_PHYPA|nr:hypothetical protein PHYPA_009340 [Physcomitrium patens]